MEFGSLVFYGWLSSLAGYTIFKVFSKPSKSKLRYRSVRRLELLNKRANKRLNNEVR